MAGFLRSVPWDDDTVALAVVDDHHDGVEVYRCSVMGVTRLAGADD